MDVLCCAGRNYFCGDAAVLLSRVEALHEGGGCFETLRFIFLFFLIFFSFLSSLSARVIRVSLMYPMVTTAAGSHTSVCSCELRACVLIDKLAILLDR